MDVTVVDLGRIERGVTELTNWLQSAALVLTSTPAEALAVAVRSLLAPLRLLRVPVSEIGGW